MENIYQSQVLTAQERLSSYGGSVIPLSIIELLQSLSPEYIHQLMMEVLSPMPPSQFPTNYGGIPF